MNKSFPEPLNPNELEINFETPQLAITSGQSIVFYQDDLLIGGAIIKWQMILL